MRFAAALALCVLCLAPLAALAADAPTPASGSPPAARDPALPAGEAQAREALNTSPRHGEYAEIPLAGENIHYRVWIVYPETRRKAAVVLVIHEIFGLSDWIRALADQLAKEGFIAVVPDLVSGYGPGGGGTESAADRDAVVKMVRELPQAEAVKRLDAARDWAARLPAASGRFATMGFCWGGGQSFAYAGSTPPPAAAVVFYGVSPDSADLPGIKAPVAGFYGGDDARVDATIPPAKQALGRLGRTYDVHVYDGAGHGFMRQQDGRDGANLKAAKQAWPAAIRFLREKLR
jgi:carboxymethylenebutenolidase